MDPCIRGHVRTCRPATGRCCAVPVQGSRAFPISQRDTKLTKPVSRHVDSIVRIAGETLASGDFAKVLGIPISAHCGCCKTAKNELFKSILYKL